MVKCLVSALQKATLARVTPGLLLHPEVNLLNEGQGHMPLPVDRTLAAEQRKGCAGQEDEGGPQEITLAEAFYQRCCS